MVWCGFVWLFLLFCFLFGLDFMFKRCLFMSAFSQERSGSTENRSEDDEGPDLCAIQNTTAKLLKLNRAIKDLHSSLSCYLRGTAFFPQ